MIYSCSAVVALQTFHSSTVYLRKQIGWAIIGFFCLLFFYRLDYRNLKHIILPWLLLTAVPMSLLSFRLIGTPIRGANRWVRLFGFSYQPSEFAKIGFIIYLAYMLEKKQPIISNFATSFLPPMIGALLFSGVVYFQPDTGAAVVFIAIAVLMCFVAGVSKFYLSVSLGAFIIPLSALLVWSSPRRLERILVFLHPEKYAQGAGFQIMQSLIAVGSGGIFGRGLGRSHQKLFFLPEAHTDFVFSIIGEELGFIGATVVIALFLLLITRGFRIAAHASDNFGSLLAFGLSSLIALNFIINLGVTIALLPTKGLALPFLSFGGSSLISNMISIGILLNISIQK